MRTGRKKPERAVPVTRTLLVGGGIDTSSLKRYTTGKTQNLPEIALQVMLKITELYEREFYI